MGCTIRTRIGAVICVVFCGGCHAVSTGYGGGYSPPPYTYVVVFKGGQPSCIIQDDGSADWALGVRGADHSWHEREVHRWIERHPDYDYGALSGCSARESAGSSRNKPSSGSYYHRRW